MIVGLLGVGAMGEAILAGLLRAGQDPGSLRVADARPERAQQISEQYGVSAAGADEAVRGAEVVVVAVKPPDVPGLLTQIAPRLDPGCVVVSIAAGLGLAALEACLPAAQPVVRVMPNTAAMVGEGMAALAAGTATGAEHLARASAVMSAVGQVVEVKESQMDAVTALSGSGPAYVMYVAEAMIDAGVLLGLPRATARQLVAQTLYGSSKLLVDTGQHPTTSLAKKSIATFKIRKNNITTRIPMIGKFIAKFDRSIINIKSGTISLSVRLISIDRSIHIQFIFFIVSTC